ncbi:MAG: hypothetical protein IH624_13445 [Phycisphaerae bacterium]|nr:hypothetical protein [Phycisphaerae bacterium]
MAKRSYDVPGVAAGFEYDNLGRVTEIDYGVSVAKFSYTYETDENNIDRKYLVHRGANKYNDYDYDDLDRLTDVTYHSAETEMFNMDNLGNRTSVTKRDASTDTYALDSATNRYDESTGGPYDVTCAYDAAGNTTRDKDNYTYWYGYENRVVKIEDSSEVTVALYDYDALGRRIREKKDFVDSAPSVVTLFYYNPDWQVLAEYDGSNGLQRHFVYGNYIDEPLVMNDGTDDFYYVQDHLYSTVALLAYDDQQTAWDVVERCEYNAYGTAHITDAAYNPRTASAYNNPYTFTGRRLDILDNGNLVRMHYRHRDYDAYAGRFVQHDPRGINPAMGNGSVGISTQYQSGINIYGYVGSAPQRYVDPLGLFGILPVLFILFPEPFPGVDLVLPDPMPPLFIVEPVPLPEPGDLWWPYEYQLCTQAPPTSDKKVCKIHGKDRIKKVGLSWGARCVCECAGTTPWDNSVRACLVCAKASNLDMQLAHKICYAAADMEHGPEHGMLARLYIPINCGYCASRCIAGHLERHYAIIDLIDEWELW